VPRKGGQGPLLVGAAKADITPALPIERSGGVGLRPPAPIAKAIAPLMAQAVSFGHSEEDTLIWVSMDLGSIELVSVNHFRESVTKATGIPPERILLSATHTHGSVPGPRFTLNRTPEQDADVLRMSFEIMKKGAAAAAEAFNRRRPARMGSARGNVERAAFNRRFIMSNGRSVMGGRGGDGLTRVEIEGPADPELQSVWFEDATTGDPIALLVNFASHPNQMYGMDMLGPEYPGVMREVVCESLGQDFPVLFLQGACGNTATRDLEGDQDWGRGLSGIDQIGRLLAAEVLRQMRGNRARPTEALLFLHRQARVPLEYRSYPPEEVAAVLELLRSKDAEARIQTEFPSLEQKARAKAIAQREALIANGVPPEVEVHAIRMGDVAVFTTSAHLFVEFQLALKAAFPERPVLWVDFTNGAHNYVPTPRAAALGGYETEHRRFEADAGDQILAAGKSLVDSLFPDVPARPGPAIPFIPEA